MWSSDRDSPDCSSRICLSSGRVVSIDWPAMDNLTRAPLRYAPRCGRTMKIATSATAGQVTISRSWRSSLVLTFISFWRLTPASAQENTEPSLFGGKAMKHHKTKFMPLFSCPLDAVLGNCSRLMLQVSYYCWVVPIQSQNLTWRVNFV